MHRALFVAHEDVADGVLLEDLVIDRKDRAAGISEYDLDALILEGFDHHLRACHLACHRGHPSIFSTILCSTIHGLWLS
jgi:hypothetical protein